MAKNLPAMQQTPVWFLGWKDPLEKGKATHSSILAWRIPRTEEPGGHSPWHHKELDMTERLSIAYRHPSFFGLLLHIGHYGVWSRGPSAGQEAWVFVCLWTAVWVHRFVISELRGHGFQHIKAILLAVGPHTPWLKFCFLLPQNCTSTFEFKVGPVILWGSKPSMNCSWNPC